MSLQRALQRTVGRLGLEIDRSDFSGAEEGPLPDEGRRYLSRRDSTFEESPDTKTNMLMAGSEGGRGDHRDRREDDT